MVAELIWRERATISISYKKYTEIVLGISIADDGYYGATTQQNHTWPLPTCDIAPTPPI